VKASAKRDAALLILAIATIGVAAVAVYMDRWQALVGLAVGVVFLVALLARKFWRGARRNLLLVFRGISGSRYMPKIGTREPTLMPTPIAQRCGVPVLYGGRLEMNEFSPRTASLSLDKKT
jgi:hypothetical protein